MDNDLIEEKKMMREQRNQAKKTAVTNLGKKSASASASAKKAEQETAVTEYTVVSGDSLSAIANRYYGDGNKWSTIYNANKEIIGDNPNLIRVGQVLNIPNLE